MLIALIVAALLAYNPFSNNASADPDTDEVNAKLLPVGPAFNADSAMAFCQAQCDFGPRTMNSEAHERCAQWIASKFRQYGMEVISQKADLTGYDGTTLHATNIIASYRPELTTRILLCAHWDSRPWADNDPDSANWRKPVMAANDGASGVGVMLEIARLINGNGKDNGNENGNGKDNGNENGNGNNNGNDKSLTSHSSPLSPNIGIDFICFDAEDWGTPQWSNTADDANSWALGAQHWAATPHKAGYEARFGILLDMVGGQGARFYQELMSKQYAPDIVRKVWRAAKVVGYESFFPKQDGGYITDDHIPVNEKARIPCIDIIAYYPDCQQSSFGPTWHTVSDDMDHLDRVTLQAVGQTVVQVLYSEK